MTHRELTYRLHKANELISNLRRENAIQLAQVRRFKTDNDILTALCGSQGLNTGVLGSKLIQDTPELKQAVSIDPVQSSSTGNPL
jgi:hypothetical protein